MLARIQPDLPALGKVSFYEVEELDSLGVSCTTIVDYILPVFYKVNDLLPLCNLFLLPRVITSTPVLDMFFNIFL